MEFNTIGFIGLGLIGGSIAKSIKRKNKNIRIAAFDTDRSNTTMAFQDKTVDVIAEEIDTTFSECDCIFLCAPVLYNIENLKKLKSIKKKDALITDVSSIKGQVHAEVDALALNDSFIGGHPMAGSEKSGYKNSTDHLMENAYYVLTPAGDVALPLISSFVDLISSIGAIPLILTHEEHDFITAAISHLPHIIASSLVNLVEAMDSKDEHMRLLAAGGFKDLTRIASSSPQMWEHICLTNHKNISKILDAYIKYLISIRVNIDNQEGEQLYQMFANSKDYRDSLPGKTSGLMKKSYIIYCDIVDQAGAIATIATILACNSISIKNIGIIHNREFEEGVLKIEFYDEASCNSANEILTSNRYTTYQIS